MANNSLEKWFKDKLDEYSNTVEFRTEEAILDFTEKICEVMEEKNISRAELAERMNVSRPFITKVLNGTTNFTLKTMVSVAIALGREFAVQMPPQGFKVPEMAVWTNVEAKKQIDYSMKKGANYLLEPFAAVAANETEYDYEKAARNC